MKQDRSEFLAILTRQEPLLRRYIASRISDRDDAEDVFQETRIAAWSGFAELRKKEQVVGWLLQIARNRCRDFFRRHSRKEVAVSDLPLMHLIDRRYFATSQANRTVLPVYDALDEIPEQERAIASQFYFDGLSLTEIANADGIPVGTAKRRLFDARQKLRAALGIPKPERIKHMKPTVAPDIRIAKARPDIQIQPSDLPLFSVDCQELRWWFIVPRLNESAVWVAYDAADGKLSWVLDLNVVGAATIHGISGVEISVHENKPLTNEKKHWTLFGRLTDDVAEYLAIMEKSEEGVEWQSFHDPDFAWNWSPCTRHLNGDSVWSVTIGGKRVVCLRVLELPEDMDSVAAHLVVSYLTREGRTLLTRHYVHERFGEYFAGPVAVNPDETFVLGNVTLFHWYDMLTSHA